MDSARQTPDLSRFVATACQRIQTNMQASASPALEKPHHQVLSPLFISKSAKRTNDATPSAEHCAFTRIGTESGMESKYVVAGTPTPKSRALALERLRFARSFLVKTDVTVYDSPVDRQKQIDSYVSRCFSKVDAMNKANDLRRHREAGDVLESGIPINSSLYRFGNSLKDLRPKLHLVRTHVDDALRE